MTAINPMPALYDGHPARAINHHLPLRAGTGLKPQHFSTIIDDQPDIGFFEVHAENYLVAGGPLHHYLQRIRRHYPLSIHGVGMSIGGQAPLNRAHLEEVSRLVQHYQPAAFSEHLAWSTHQTHFLNDLLPLPYTKETLLRVCSHIDQVQEKLKRTILFENPATYVEFAASTWSETAFLTEILSRTGCGLLLDINNLHISSINHHYDAVTMLQELPTEHVGEIHLAGHTQSLDSMGAPLLIDSHDCQVSDPVWALYKTALRHTGPVATIIEWDSNIPAFSVLMEEVQRADYHLRSL